MKINDKREREMQSFKSILHIGEIFEYGSGIYMTVADVSDDDGNYYNVLRLNDGKFAYFKNEQVQVLNNVALEIR